MEMQIDSESNFLDAHMKFYKIIAQSPNLVATETPINADKFTVRYCIIQKGNTLYCEYQIDDRQYTKTEIKRLLKKVA